MINDIAAELIHNLRFDAHTREHFSISDWVGKKTCGSVGCIAGTALFMVGIAEAKRLQLEIDLTPTHALQNRFFHLADDVVNRTRVAKDKAHGFSKPAAIILGLPNFLVGDQLFTPWTSWELPLSNDDTSFLTCLSDNERPALDTIQKMVSWAKSLPRGKYNPSHCANALEDVLQHERMYVDWAEAWRGADCEEAMT